MANIIFNSFKKNVISGVIDLDTDTLKLALVTSSYNPDQDTHEFFSSVTNEVVGTGYTAGGKVLTSKAVAQDNTNNISTFDADDVVWASSTVAARGAVLYKDTGSPATSPLICYVDFGSDKSSAGDNFTVKWSDSNKILRFA